MDARTVVLLVVQAALAVVALHLLNRRVFPHMRVARQPELVADVWAPLAMVLPLLFLAGRVEATVRGVGWAPIGGPICVGALALGAALITGRGEAQADRPGGAALLCWAGAGLVLLMLGAAHDLSIWTGQCIFALAAVLLWLNTPALAHPGSGGAAHRPLGGELSMAFVLLCAIGQGMTGLVIGDRGLPISAAMMVAYAGAVGAGAAVIAGPGWAMRIGGWAAAIGMLLGIGLISLLRLLPQAIAVTLYPHAAVRPEVAHSFGAYALEAILLLLAPAAAAGALRLPRPPVAWLGAAILLAGALVATWRVASLS
ncbi:MAG: hypothetical protein SYC29_16540 [Planctomycetota bacterium]|nr:hypothetical protein [Planctomycetota bacterium]